MGGLTHPRWRPLTEGVALLAPLVIVGIVLLRFFPRAAALPFAAAIAVAFAFRDPERRVERKPGVAIAPADGRVLHVLRTWDEYWETEMLEIGIFLALWEVHVQRSPLAGEVVSQQRRAGGYRPAMTSEATHGNNQVATYIKTDDGPCTVTQISGLVARRIVTWAATGDRIEQGERLGMIKFGSQVTLRVPASASALVEVGDRVEAGLTPMAALASVAVTTSPTVADRSAR